jgi:quercetin dioxygenase-like cupin family protein
MSADADPVSTNPEHYRVVLENDRVRVLEYQDSPGDSTSPHAHPDSVMITASSFQRRLQAGGREVDIELPAGAARWVGAQEHSGVNTGTGPTHVFFIELKEPAPETAASGAVHLGPEGA